MPPSTVRARARAPQDTSFTPPAWHDPTRVADRHAARARPARPEHPRPRLRRRRRRGRPGSAGGAGGVRRRPGATRPPRRRARGTAAGPGCWCRWSRCSARSSTTSTGWPTTRPATWPPCCSPGATGGRRCWRSPASTTLTAWNPDARPVPVPAATGRPVGAAGGRGRARGRRRRPHAVAVEGEDLQGLARGWTLVPTADGPPGSSGPARNSHLTWVVVTLVTDRSGSSLLSRAMRPVRQVEAHSHPHRPQCCSGTQVVGSGPHHGVRRVVR